jgi:hypothetical protein
MKPRDEVVASESYRLGLKEVDDWPPKKPWFGQPSNRHVIWPKHTFNPDADNARLAQVFRKAILHRYKTGDGICFADELYGLSVELGLYSETEAMLTRGGGMGAGMWLCHAETFRYSARGHYNVRLQFSNPHVPFSRPR